MIRRHAGNEFWLITQDDHARLSGAMAEQFGANGYAAPDTRTILGTSLHDCGWPLHDDQPTLNPQGMPLDVFETPRTIGPQVWAASAERAAERDPYAGLLVSLHSLWISVTASGTSSPGSDRWDMSDRATRFQVNQFQQGQIELQEALRRRLGMRTDEPRKYGLNELSDDPREKQLIFDFRLLQAMDRLSLAICCTAPPAAVIGPLPTRPGGADRPLRVARRSPWHITVTPWPFREEPVEASVPFRRLPARPFEDDAAFRAEYAAAAVDSAACVLTSR
jgi:hypothetical protein